MQLINNILHISIHTCICVIMHNKVTIFTCDYNKSSNSPGIFQQDAVTLVSTILSLVFVKHCKAMFSSCCLDPQTQYHSANQEVAFSKFLSLFTHINSDKKCTRESEKCNYNITSIQLVTTLKTGLT